MFWFAEDRGAISPHPTHADAPADQSVASEVNDVLRSMMPWLTSMLVHLGIVILAIFAVWGVIASTAEEEEVIIPMARLAENPGGQLSQSQDIELQNTQQTRQVVTESLATDEAVNSLATSSNTEALQLVGLSGGASGKLAPFGTTTGGGAGIQAQFFGAGGNATKLIYIVDASGSLIDTLPYVIKELKRSISELSDRQQFTIIFFQAGRELEVPPRGWKNATDDMKQRVNDFITLENGNIIPRGSTDPVAAIKLAMRYKPELVFILSDNITGRGRYEVDRDQLLKLINEATRDNPQMKINTIQFVYTDPLDTLKSISEKTGGIHTFITEADLGLQ